MAAMATRAAASVVHAMPGGIDEVLDGKKRCARPSRRCGGFLVRDRRDYIIAFGYEFRP